MSHWFHRIEQLGWAFAATLFASWLIWSPEFNSNAAAENQLLQQKTKTAEPVKTGAKTDAKKTVTKSVKKSVPEKDPPKNILGRFFRKLIPTKKPNRILPKKVAPKGGADTELVDPKNPDGDYTARDHIDARAPYDSSDTRRLRQAEKFMKNGNWKLATISLQKLLDRKEDSLVRTPRGTWISLREEATRLLGNLPKDYQATYSLQYGKPSEQALAEALQKGDMRKVSDLATRYFQTKAGRQAANFLVSWYIDRGEHGMAARWMRRLLDAKATVTSDAKWLTKAAATFQTVGDTVLAERLLKAVEAQMNGNTLAIAGHPRNPREWLALLKNDQSETVKPLGEWRNFFGTPSRVGTMQGGAPLLLARWKHSTSHSHALHGKIDGLVQTLSDKGRAMVPSLFPLAVKNKVIFRTMRGVLVVDARTGKPLWETKEGVSPERIFSGLPRTSSFNSGLNRARFRSRSYGSTSGERDPLVGLLFRNGTFGNLSSDGNRLFVIEDHAILSKQQPGNGSPSDPDRYDTFRRSWSTNKLTAYDLNTGRPLWALGGRKRDEPFDLPLAGTYFFGTPIADRGELFITGEARNEIRVYAINAQTGKLNWSQRIAKTDNKINRDFGRRWFTSQIAVSDGMLICPTTVGWLVAVNRMNHSVLWAHRYSKPTSQSSTTSNQPKVFGSSNRSTMVQYSDLNNRWSPSAPVITRGHVVYTPSNDPHLVCLKLFDGKPAWKIPKSTYLYLAGVFGERVVLVGKTAITAVSLTSGTTAWTLPLPPSSGLPSGMGVAAGNHYHLPLSTGQLWTIDLNTGKRLSRLYLPETERPLGNLAMYQGMLLSLNPFGMTSFEQRAAIEAKIKERKAQSPNDVWALLREVEIHQLKRNNTAALATLRKIRPADVFKELTPRYRKAMIESLTGVIRSDLSKFDNESRELSKFVRSPEERFAYQMLAAVKHDSRKEYVQAFDIYSTLTGQSDQKTVSRSDRPEIAVTSTSWLSGRLADLYQRADENSRNQLDQKVIARAKAVAKDDLVAEQQFCALFGFHVSAVEIWNRQADVHLTADRFGSAEQIYRTLSQHQNPDVAAIAIYRAANLYDKFGLTRDAAKTYRELAKRFPTAKLKDGKTVGELIDSLRGQGRLSDKRTRKLVSWKGSKMVMETSGTRYSSTPDQELIISSTRWPYFYNHRFYVNRTQQKMEVTNISDNSLRWLVPLRANSRMSQSNLVTARAGGHLLFVLNRGVLHCLSPVDRKILWTQTLESKGPTRTSGVTYYGRSSASKNSVIRTMRDSRQAVTQWNVWNSQKLHPSTPVANERYVGIYGRRTFSVLDALTGKQLWKHSKTTPGTRVVGTRSVLFMVPSQKDQAVALRASDGKTLPIKDVAKLLDSTITIIGDHLVVMEVKSSSFLGFSKQTTTLRMMNPLTGKNLWKKTFKTGAKFSVTHDGSLITMKRTGQLEIVDLQTGNVKSIGTLTKNELRSKSQYYTILDRDSLILVANSNGYSGTYYSGGMSSIRVNGTIFGFDRQSGRRLWSQPVKSRQLITQYLSHSPVLMFSSRKYIRRGNITHGSFKILAMDKRSGDRLIDTKLPTSQYYQSLKVNVPDRFVEFRSYNHRIRLRVVDRNPAGPTKAIKPKATPSG